MVEKKKVKGKRRKGPRERRERRFLPEPAQTSKPVAIGGMASAVLLGVGVYAAWITSTPLSIAPVLVAVGAGGLAASLWFGDKAFHPVRIGDAGVAVERGSETERIMWCDLERIFVDRDNLVLRGGDQRLSVPLAAHPLASAWILQEAVRRVPDTLDVKRELADKLPKPKDTDGELVRLEGLQLAGRACAQSGEPISFERDARLCPTCGEVYLKSNVPATCVTCEGELGSRAFQVS